MKEPNKQ